MQLDTNGDGAADATTLADAQGNFSYSFSPASLAYGQVTVAARTVQHGAGPLTYSPWYALTFTYEAPPADAPSIDNFSLANPSPGSASAATDPTLTGTVAYNQLSVGNALSGVPGADALNGVPSTQSILSHNVDFLKVEFDYDGDGTPDASTTTGPGGTFTFKPAGLAFGQVTLRARAIGQAYQPDGSIVDVEGDWASLTFTYNQAAANVPSVSSLVLASPLPSTGGSTESATSPAVVGQLSTASGQSPTAVSFLTVEFDTNGDGVPDANVQADATGNFSFTPTGLPYGSVTIAARVRQHDYATGGFDFSSWTTLAFTYQAAAGATAPSIASLALLDDSGSSASDGVTANASVRGQLSVASGQLPVGLFVQVDTNGDRVADATVFPDANGDFTFTPSGLAYGPVTIAARAESWDAASGSYLTGNWTSLSFTYEQEANAVPVIAALGLIDANGKLDTEVSTSTTVSQPVIGGQLTYQSSVDGLTVEVDTTGAGTPDATVTTDQYGDFQYTPSGLTPGAVTIYVRTVNEGSWFGVQGSGNSEESPNPGGPLIGAWTPISFTYVAPTIAPPTISNLALADDTGTSNTDKITTDPTLSGNVAQPPSAVGEDVTSPTPNSEIQTPVIQFDTNADGVPDGTTVAASDGTFAWTPTGLASGTVTIAARAVAQMVEADGTTAPIYGAWTSLTFTLQATAPAAATVVSSLGLADNVGPTSTALVSTDGAIRGQIAAPPGSTASLSGVSLQIDINPGAPGPDATVTTDGSGNFSYTPPAGSLPSGVVKIYVRTADQAAEGSGFGVQGSGNEDSPLPPGEGQDEGGSPTGPTYGTAGPNTVTGDAASGYWTSVSFVLSSTPSDPGVQAQAETLSANMAAAAQAASAAQSTGAGATAALEQAQATTAAAYNASLAKAGAAQQSAGTSAAASFQAALAAASAASTSALGQTATYSITVSGSVLATMPDFYVSRSSQPDVAIGGFALPSGAGQGDGGGYDFGYTPQGAPLAEAFRISNSTAADVAVDDLALPAGFSLLGAFPSSVPAGGSATFIVQFNGDPGAPGPGASGASGALTFSDTADGGGTYSIALAASIAPAASLSMSVDGAIFPLLPGDGDWFNFGATLAGTPVQETVTVTNSGSADAPLGEPSLPAGFSIVGDFPSDVPAGGSATFTIQLDAPAAGSSSGDFSLDVPGAAGTLNNELAAFAGDTTSFSYLAYAWPDAPPDLPAPDEPTATSPVAAPSFDGVSFDPTQDAAYDAAVTADQQGYDTAVDGAESGYQSDLSDAAALEAQALDAARQVKQQAFDLADQIYQAAMDDPNPTDLTAAQNALAAADSKAASDYHDKFIEANGTFLITVNDLYETYTTESVAYSNQLVVDYKTAEDKCNARIGSITAEGDLGEQEYFDALHAYDVDRANADVKYAKLIDTASRVYSDGVDSAQATHDNTVADALQVELKAYNDAYLVYAKAYLEYQRWNTAHPLDADRDRQLAYDKAEHDYAVSQAQAAQGYYDAVATAAQKRDKLIADAAQAQEEGDATALADAAQTYLSSVGNALSGISGSAGQASGVGLQASGAYELAWAGYQAALADDESQYETSDAGARHTLAYAEADAAFQDQKNVDQANETRDQTLADDAKTVADAEANADHDWRVGRAQDDKDLAVNGNTAWNADADGWADADHSYNLVSIAAWHTLGDEQAKADQDLSDGTAEAEAAYVASGDYNAEVKTLAALTQAYLTAIGESFREDGYKEVAAGLTAATTQDGLIEAYNDAGADNTAAWQKQYDTLLGADEITVGTALATQDKLDTAARDTADETAANHAAGEATADALAEQAYNDTDAADQSTQDIADVEAQQTMEESEADAYSSALQAWSTSVGNALSGVPGGAAQAASALEQYQQAQADDAWIHSVTDAQVADVTAEDGLQAAWAKTVDAAAELEQTGDADTIAAAIVAADQTDAQSAIDRDAAWTTEVNNLAGAATTYDGAAADAADREEPAKFRAVRRAPHRRPKPRHSSGCGMRSGRGRLCRRRYQHTRRTA